MEEVSPLECMNKFIQLKNEIIETKRKLTEKREAYIQIHTAILEEQMLYPTIKARLGQTRKALRFAGASNISHQTGNNNKEEEERRRRLYLARLESLERKYSQILIKLDYPQYNPLEKKLEKCINSMKLYEEKTDELEKQCFRLLDIIRLADKIKVKNVKDVDTVLSFREKNNWSCKICLADDLSTSQKYVLSSYITSKRH